MSLWGAFSNSSNAMMAQSTSLSIVSQNVANMNTAGYKRGVGEFKTLLTERTPNPASSSVNGPLDSFSVKISSRTMVDRSGTMVTSGNPYDLAINGDGMFIVNTEPDGSGEQLYTRAGNFSSMASLDATGYATSILGTPDGKAVMGWAVDPQTGTFPTTGGTLEAINLRAESPLPAHPTETVNLWGNLDARETALQTLSVPVVDNAGTTQSMVLDFTRPTGAGTNTWNLDFVISGGTVTSPVAGANPVTFSSDAQMQTPNTFDVAVTWDDGTQTTVAVDMTPFTQFSADTMVKHFTQDGYEAGDFVSSHFDNTGVLYYSYDNGATRPAFKLPVATFTAPNSLENRNGTLFAETENSGTPSVTAFGQDGAGHLEVEVYESANVDIADEFTNMMLAQKAYSLASQTFRTTDEMLQQAASLLR